NPFLEQGSVLAAFLFQPMPQFDPFLFFATTVPFVTLSWTALCFAVLCATRLSADSVLRITLAAICVASLGHYVGWEIESPGVGWSLVMIFPIALLRVAVNPGIGW